MKISKKEVNKGFFKRQGRINLASKRGRLAKNYRFFSAVKPRPVFRKLQIPLRLNLSFVAKFKPVAKFKLHKTPLIPF